MLRQNYNLYECNARFGEDGDYASLELSDYCLVDFRLDSPDTCEFLASDLEMHDKLFIMIYNADMTSA